MKRPIGAQVASVALLLAAGLATATPVLAWNCVPGAADTPENRERGLCVEHGAPAPRHHKEHHKPKPVVVPTPVPTTAPAVQAPTQPSTTRLAEYCHFEVSTGMFEIRRTSDLLKALSQPGNEAIAAEHVCNQHAPVETVVVSVPAPVVVPSVPVEVAPVVVQEAAPPAVVTETTPPEQKVQEVVTPPQEVVTSPAVEEAVPAPTTIDELYPPDVPIPPCYPGGPVPCGTKQAD